MIVVSGGLFRWIARFRGPAFGCLSLTRLRWGGTGNRIGSEPSRMGGTVVPGRMGEVKREHSVAVVAGTKLGRGGPGHNGRVCTKGTVTIGIVRT